MWRPPRSTLSLHAALPIFAVGAERAVALGCHLHLRAVEVPLRELRRGDRLPDLLRSSRRGTSDRKSTRLNSSHVSISYAVFCVKKKSTTKHTDVLRFQLRM